MDIREHMEVVGSDGQQVGTVDEVEGDRIKLTKKDSNDGALPQEAPCERRRGQSGQAVGQSRR